MPDWSLSGKVLFAGYPGANGSDLYSIELTWNPAIQPD